MSTPLVGILMGSKSDWEAMKQASDMLTRFGVAHESRVMSAHRTPGIVAEYASGAAARGLQVIIAGAGGAAHLAGATLAAASAAPPADRSAPSPLLERFLSFIEPAVVEYRAFRHLEAQNDRFNSSAWMDVWTETNRDGEFSYRIVGQGGSSYIRSRVFLPALEGERQVCGSSGCDRGALTGANYVFEDRREEKDGLAWLMVKPRRKDVVLVEGSLFLNPDDGDLVRMEGRLSKT